MQKLIKVLVATDLLLANSAYADGINVKAAYGDALEFVVLKFLIAAILFYLFTYDLIGKARDTPLKSARWIGSILLALGVGASTNSSPTLPDYIYGVSLVAISLYVIGFVIGYIWKPWAIKGQSEDSNSYLKACLPLCFGVIVIIGLSVSFAVAGDYRVYECPNRWTGKDCSGCKKNAYTLSFKTNINKQFVIIQIYDEKNNPSSYSPDSCKVIDDKNWTCSEEYGDETRSSEMVNGVFKSIVLESGSTLCAKKSGWFN